EAAKRPPEQFPVLSSLGPAMANFSGIGLILMLVTGFALVFVKYSGFAGLPPLFWLKMLFVTTLTLASIGVHLTYAQIKAGSVPAASRLRARARVAVFSSFLPVFVAVLVFH